MDSSYWKAQKGTAEGDLEEDSGEGAKDAELRFMGGSWCCCSQQGSLEEPDRKPYAARQKPKDLK